MSDLVPSESIERIVGAARHPTDHIGRAVSAEQTFYILHSRACLNNVGDLRECAYSVALDWGIDPAEWTEDVPTRLEITDGRLAPSTDLTGRSQ